MEANELKFLLKLLDYRDYRANLSDLRNFNPKERNRICQELGSDGLVDFSREIVAVKIAPPGSALLKMDISQLPISVKEQKLLEKLGKAPSIVPSNINIQIKGHRLKVSERDAILQRFRERGLIEVETKLKRTGAKVWLTQRGQECLQQLNHYFQSLRESSGIPEDEVKLSDEEILQVIRNLDQEFATDNYLPIFYLRQKLQSSLSREELDRALYRLQGKNKIELRAVVHSQDYTADQINAGILQRVGNPLFFIKVMWPEYQFPDS